MSHAGTYDTAGVYKSTAPQEKVKESKQGTKELDKYLKLAMIKRKKEKKDVA